MCARVYVTCVFVVDVCERRYVESIRMGSYMYVCVCTYVCVCVCTYVYTSVRVCVYTRHLCGYIYISRQ